MRWTQQQCIVRMTVRRHILLRFSDFADRSKVAHAHHFCAERIMAVRRATAYLSGLYFLFDIKKFFVSFIKYYHLNPKMILPEDII